MASDDMSYEDILMIRVSPPIPLSEPVLLILLSLSERPRHGYSILKDVEDVSDGRVVLSTGTLYGALRRLLESGWIERFAEDDAARDRHAYHLTAEGRRLLQTEIARMKALTRLANSRLAQERT
jgi:DNA-binding PadR family transcriptional regulator